MAMRKLATTTQQQDTSNALVAATCAPSCGKWTDPATQAFFDLSRICGKELTISEPNFSYRLNICGKTSCGNSGGVDNSTTGSSGPTFCSEEKDSVCSFDPQGLHVGMVLRTGSQPCGTLVSCERCDVLAGVTDGTAEFAVLEDSPYKGVAMTLPPVQLTAVQNDQLDKLGYCIGGPGRVTRLEFQCDCKLDEDVKGVVDKVSLESPASCFTKFQIRSKFACYEGFCDGLPPPGLQPENNGWLIALVLIAIVLLALYVIKKRGYQRLLGLTERFSKPAYAGLTSHNQGSELRPLGEDDGL